MEGWQVAKMEIANLPDKLSGVNFLLAKISAYMV